MKGSLIFENIYNFGHSFLTIPIDYNFQDEKSTSFEKVYNKSQSLNSNSTSFNSSIYNEADETTNSIISFTSLLRDDWKEKAKKFERQEVRKYQSLLKKQT